MRHAILVVIGGRTTTHRGVGGAARIGQIHLAGTSGITGISSDSIRQVLADDATDQTIHARVFLTMRYLLRHRLGIGRPVSYVDATHLTPDERRPYIRIAQWFGCEVEAVYFDVPLAVCRERNLRRDRVVPDDALERMAAKLVAPDAAEGFSRITVVR